jgi:hypothetical protein
MNRSLRSLTLALGLASTSCSSSLSQPFAGLKSQPITIFRLQNFEPPMQQAGTAVPGANMIPPQIQQWLSAGAAMLPPGLLPPGLLPGGTPAAPAAQNVPRFYNFRILQTVQVTDKQQAEDILDLFGKDSNFQVPSQQCMYAEFGFQVGQPPAPGAPQGMPSTAPPADILVSLSCDQVQMFNYGWPYGQKTGLGPDTQKKLSAILRKAFGG